MKRRQLIQSLTANSLILPRLFGSQQAWAEELPTKRFLIVHTHHGVYHPTWKLRREDDDHANNNNHIWDRRLHQMSFHNSALEPLKDFRDKMMVVDGLSMLSAEGDPNGTRHQIGEIHALTGNVGTTYASYLVGSSPSFDQIVAQGLATPGRFTSLEWAVGQPFNTVVWKDALHPAPFINTPTQAWAQLSGGTSRTLSPTAQQELLRHVHAKYVSTHEQSQLESLEHMHTQLSSSIERQNFIRSQQNSCTSLTGVSNGYYDADFRQFNDLIHYVFSCDLSRVITLNLGPPPVELFITDSFADFHAQIHSVHRDDEARSIMTRYNRYHANHLATIAATLDGQPDPTAVDGSSLLDNTLILWVSEMADPAHYFQRWPVVMLGGQKWHNLNMGRYVHFPLDQPFDGNTEDGLAQMGRPHQRLFMTLAMQFGLNLDYFGLPSIKGTSGDNIDCRGVLDDLLA